MLLPLALILERPRTLEPPPAAVPAALLGLAVLSTAIACGLYVALIASAGAVNAVLVTVLMPVSATRPASTPHRRHGADRAGSDDDRPTPLAPAALGSIRTLT
ncbi:MAG: hypothetical protein Kow0013_16500 [Pararhodobacter sp.]